MPSEASRFASSTSEATVCCTTPGSDGIGTGASIPSRTNSGATRSSTLRHGLGHEAAHRGQPAQPPQAAGRKRPRVGAYRAACGAAPVALRPGNERCDEPVDGVDRRHDVDLEAGLAAPSAAVTGPMQATTGGTRRHRRPPGSPSPSTTT